jgi:hypothetical protein
MTQKKKLKWKDVTFFNPNPNMPYLVRLVFWWFSTNVGVFAGLCGISYLLSCGSMISPNTCVGNSDPNYN